MACCGENRARVSRGRDAPAAVSSPRRATSQRWSTTTGPTNFEYIGRSSLTVTAPRSGRRYYFAHPGAVVLVEERDVRALMGVTALQLVDG
jgi:hypothetical protein